MVSAPCLTIRPEKASSPWRVWPDPEAIAPGAVQEGRDHIFELSAPRAEQADLFIDDVKLEPLRVSEKGVARWRWSLGFNAGVAEAELRIPGEPCRRFEVVTDPDIRKLTRADFDEMVREILDDTFALFSLSSFRKGVAKGAGGRPPAIARLEFLRSRIAEIEQVVAAIVRAPRRVLSAEIVPTPYYRAVGATGPEILASFRTGRIARETSGAGRLPTPLKGFLPEKIGVRKKRSSLDLPEHRQIGACLRSWASWLNAVSDILARDGDLKEHGDQFILWSHRCRQLARRLSTLALSAPFMEAGEAPPRLQLSALFRRDAVYRRFYRLWHDMNLGIAGIFGDYLNLPIRRTYELYELWCYLRLVRAAANSFGPANVDCSGLFIADAAGGLTLATGAVTVDVGGDWLLCFQKQYREFWVEPDGRGSFSRVMVPDIVAQRRNTSDGEQTRVIVLDAKYRIDLGLNDALSSIHMYRDALVRDAGSGKTEGVVAAAYLIAPYLPSLSLNYKSTGMPGRLFHPDYRAGFRFGAVTMRPGMSHAAIEDVLKGIVADATAVF